MITIVMTFVIGLLLGLIISAPMGPVGILCVRRTLHKGRKAGLLTGIGATIGDLIYAVSTYLLTYLGLSFVFDWIDAHHTVLKVIAILIILIFGIQMFYSNPNFMERKNNPDFEDEKPWQMVVSSFAVAMSNPLMIIIFMAFFSRFSLSEEHINPWLLFSISILSIAIGAFIWWCFITYLVQRIRESFSIGSLRTFNRILSLIFIAIAIGMAIYVMVQHL